MDFPTIFDLLERLDFMRGYPAVYVVMGTAVLIAIFLDWRLSALALLVQYFASGLLYVDLLDPRLAVVKVIVGLFVSLILFLTAWQVDYGRLPPDLTPEEVAHFKQENRWRIGRFSLPGDIILRLALSLGLLLLILLFTRRSDFMLPGIAPGLETINLAALALGGLGLLGIATSREPLPAGMNMFVFLTGFELYYSALDQSVATLALLAALNFAIALAVAYLTQARRALSFKAVGR